MRTSPRCGAAAAVWLLAGLSGLATGCAGEQEQADERIMLVGDSITQGRVGDVTWRYRLARLLDAEEVDYDLVGPFDGVYDRATGSYDSSEYRRPHFDRDHAALWGATYDDIGSQVRALAAEHRPAIVVNLLGTNDLRRKGSGPEQVAQDAAALVADVRASVPDAVVILMHVPGPIRGADRLDPLLDRVAAELDRPQSPVLIGQVAGGRLTKDDLYDGLHPDAAGEQKIAAGVAVALRRARAQR